MGQQVDVAGPRCHSRDFEALPLSLEQRQARGLGDSGRGDSRGPFAHVASNSEANVEQREHVGRLELVGARPERQLESAGTKSARFESVATRSCGEAVAVRGRETGTHGREAGAWLHGEQESVRVLVADAKLRPFSRLDDHLPAGAHEVLASELCTEISGRAQSCRPDTWSAARRGRDFAQATLSPGAVTPHGQTALARFAR
jgi:hypothetical protein